MTHHIIHRALPLTIRFSSGGAKELLARDRARAQKLLAGKHPHGPVAFHEAKRSRHHHRHHHGTPFSSDILQAAAASGSVDVTDSGMSLVFRLMDPTFCLFRFAGVTYTLPVGVGSPATQYTLLIDTGSSNTWVGAGTKYVPTSTSTDTNNTVNVSYGSGSFSGTECTRAPPFIILLVLI
jgi:hypothetical protein